VSAPLVLRPEAEADIAEAYEWYESRSPGLGTRFLDAVASTLTSVRDAPDRFPVLHDEPSVAVRRALVAVFPYGVFYVWDARTAAISIIACMHARRDPRRWLTRA
jgi:plasmid stabilization system protein ParE